MSQDLSPTLAQNARPIREIGGITPEQFRSEIVPSGRPAVFRGIAAHWPAVAAPDFAAFMAPLADATPRDALIADPGTGGRFFYTDDMAGFNFTRAPMTVPALFQRLLSLVAEASPPAIAMQSIPPEAVPDFASRHRLDLAPPDVKPRLWIGNRTVTALHHDIMSNLAVVVAGRRRFLLVPPAATPALYTGPLEFTPAGTPVSLVDPEAPDFARHPRFAAVADTVEGAELEPGDAIYIPYMWWHQVRSLDPISALANFWWTEGPEARPGMAPVDVLVHALLAFRDLPDEQRRAWQAMFQAKVFEPDHRHIAPARRGILGEVSDQQANAIVRQLATIMHRGAG